MTSTPFGQVERGAFALVRGNGVAIEEVGHDYSIACASNGVGDTGYMLEMINRYAKGETEQFVVGRCDAIKIGNEKDCFASIVVPVAKIGRERVVNLHYQR